MCRCGSGMYMYMYMHVSCSRNELFIYSIRFGTGGPYLRPTLSPWDSLLDTKMESHSLIARCVCVQRLNLCTDIVPYNLFSLSLSLSIHKLVLLVL